MGVVRIDAAARRPTCVDCANRPDAPREIDGRYGLAS